MKVDVMEVQVELSLYAGDVVVFDTEPYILMEVANKSGEYELRSFNGVSGACGRCSLEGIRDYVIKRKAKVYSSNTHKLILKSKDN